MGKIEDKRQFILDHTAFLPVPLTPNIRLQLADDQTPLWRMQEEELLELGLPSPFWAFAWAGGQALARYCLDNPTLFKNKRIIDFASGSGLVAIAAAMAGASQILATDIDPFSVVAIEINAEKNNVQLQASIDNLLTEEAIKQICANPPDFFLAGDVFYDAPMTKAVLALLKPLAQKGTQILIGDPSRSYLPQDHLERVEAYQVPVTRELEDYEIRSTKVWRYKE